MYWSNPTTWTITDMASDGSWAATYEATTEAVALELLARDEGFKTFAEYCTARDRLPSDFAVTVDYGAVL